MSPFIADLIDELGYERVRSVASGNRAMMLLEGKGGAYIRDTGGFAKWDTSGPQVPPAWDMSPHQGPTAHEQGHRSRARRASVQQRPRAHEQHRIVHEVAQNRA